MNDFQNRLIKIIDNAADALDRGNRKEASIYYAQASELLFMQVTEVKSLALKSELLGKAKTFLATSMDLHGNTEKDDSAEKTPLGKPLNSGVTFADIAGLEDVKETLRMRMIYPLKNPEALKKYGLKMGGGMLLYGPPGTGKTLVAKAVAGELGLPFYVITPSKILSQFYGQSEKQLAELFEEVRTHHEGAVVFIDEIDAIGASRSDPNTSEPARRLLNQLLQELDGVNGRPEGMLFLAATNEPWLLDEALLRPPRFSEKCFIPLPDRDARTFIIKLKLKGCPLAPDVSLEQLADLTEGYSGADMEGVCERAKMIPYRESIITGNDRPVSLNDFYEALKLVRPTVSEETIAKFNAWVNR